MVGWCAAAVGQTGKLTGTVSDAESKTPLELATVSILGQDSSLVTYQLSDIKGRFNFDKLPLKKKLLVSVTYTGYLGFNTSIHLEAGKVDTLAVLMALNMKDTQAIVITTTIPIRMNGDTLELNPAAFKMKENAVVEELLNQVSGITIWSDGTITVNGQKVQSLLVDGKPFMGSNDSRVATQNLPKSAIDKIQLYQEYDRTNIGRETQPQDSVLTMNIKLKESSKKGYFGKAGAGYGTEERFESDLSFQVYNKRSSIGIGGGFNNINKSIGSLQELFQNNTFRNFNPNLYSVGRFGASGINKNYSFGGILSHSFIEATNSRQVHRISVNYNTSGTNSYITDLNLQSRTTLANPQAIRDEGIQNTRNTRHDLGINYVKTNSYNDNLNINGSLNSYHERGQSSRYTEVRDTSNQLQSTNGSNAQQRRQSETASVNASFAKSDRDDPLKGVTFSVNARNSNSVSERDVQTVFESFTNSSKNTTFNRRYESKNQSQNIGSRLDYAGIKRLLLGRYNLFGINMSFTQEFNYNRQSDHSTVNDFDSVTRKFSRNTNLSNRNERELMEYTPAFGLTKNFHKWDEAFFRNLNFNFRVLNEFEKEKNISSIAKRNLTRSFSFLRYEGSASFNHQQREKYQLGMSLNYGRNYTYPSVDMLYTIVDDINVYETRFGNPFLRNRINNNYNINANFNTQNPKSVYSLNAHIGGGYTRSVNPVADSVINDPSGKRFSYFVNADESNNMNLNYNFNISRKFNKNNLQLMYNGQMGTGEMPNYIDALYNISETRSMTNQVNLQFSLGSILVVNAGQTLQHYKTRQTAAKLTPFTNRNTISKAGIVVNYPEGFTFSSTVDHIDNSNLNKPTILWNSFATYRFMKQQAEVKLSAMDLLNQYQNITNSVNSYGTSTRITNGLQQYFLLTLSYYPRKFGKKAGG
jgi:hypothetical protein